MNKFQDWTNGTSDINKYNKALEDSEQKVSDNNSQMEEYQNELSQNKDKLEELQKLQNNGTITEAQKTEIEFRVKPISCIMSLIFCFLLIYVFKFL